MALVPNGGQPVTMTSLELVDFINADRQERAKAAGADFPSKGFAKLEHADLLKKVPEVLGEHAGKFSCMFDVPIGNGAIRQSRGYRFPKREACLMAMSYSYELQAKVFDRMTELEAQVVGTAPVLPASRSGKVARSQHLSRNQVAASILLLRSAAEDLKFAPSAVLGGYQRLESQLGVTGLLPAYSVDAPPSAGGGSSEETKAAADLLEAHGVGMSAIAFNRLLVQRGFLAERERPSSKGGVKKFKACSNFEFGKNITNPTNPRETQPHWYVSKFAELLDLVLPHKPRAGGA